jgi:hypothetical protein
MEQMAHRRIAALDQRCKLDLTDLALLGRSLRSLPQQALHLLFNGVTFAAPILEPIAVHWRLRPQKLATDKIGEFRQD